MIDPQPVVKLTDQVWFSTREAAAYARCSVETIKRAIAAKALRSSQAGVGGWHRFHRDWLDTWMANRHNLPAPRVLDGKAPRQAAS